MEAKYSLRSPAVKRLMREAKELHQPTEHYYAQPLDDNLFEWHFTVRGPADTEFEGGFYHGRIILPPDYPMKPPSIILLTPNGRFETSTKICLSISGYHPESWQPSWSIRTAMMAIIGFMPTKGAGAIGSLDYTPAERKVLSKKSQEWKCSECGPLTGLLLPAGSCSQSEQDSTTKEAAEMAQQISFKKEEPKTSSPSGSEATVQPPLSTTTAATAVADSTSLTTNNTQQIDQFSAFMQATQLNNLSFDIPTFSNNNEYLKFYESYVRSYQQLATLSMSNRPGEVQMPAPLMYNPGVNMTPRFDPNIVGAQNLHQRNIPTSQPVAGTTEPNSNPPLPQPVPQQLRVPAENPRNDVLMFLIAVAVMFLMLALIYRRFDTHYYRFAF